MERHLLFFSLLLLFLASCDYQKLEEKSQETVGVGQTKIRIGSSSALSGHAGFLGAQYLNGALTYIKEINVKGGVHGRLVEVVALDDQYNPVKTIANTQKLIYREKVFCLFNYVGTPTSVAAKPIIEDTKIPILGFFTGAEKLRTPPDPNIFHVRDSYYAEAEGAVAYFVDSLGLKKIGVFYQEDAFGIAVLTGIQLALKRRNMEPVVTDTYIRGSMDVEESVERIAREKVDVIMMVGTYSPLAKFIQKTHELNHYPMFSTVSFVGSEAYASELINEQKIAQQYYKDIIVTQVVPSPYTFTFRAAEEYLHLNTKYFPEDTPNYVAFEGFLNAKILVLGLQRCGRDLTRTGFTKALRSIQNYDLGIEKRISFGENDQEGIKGVYYSQLRPNGRFEIYDQ